LWRINRDMLGWGRILSNQHQQLLDYIEDKVDRPAEEVMLEHLSYRYQHPERFSSLALSPARSEPASDLGQQIAT